MQATVQTGFTAVDAGQMVRGTLPNELAGDSISERRLWTAVLVKAIEDWRGGSLRARRDAQRFLFENGTDFAQVCAAAGIDPDHFRAKLSKIGKRVAMTGPWGSPIAA